MAAAAFLALAFGAPFAEAAALAATDAACGTTATLALVTTTLRRFLGVVSTALGGMILA